MTKEIHIPEKVTNEFYILGKVTNEIYIPEKVTKEIYILEMSKGWRLDVPLIKFNSSKSQIRISWS